MRGEPRDRYWDLNQAAWVRAEVVRSAAPSSCQDEIEAEHDCLSPGIRTSGIEAAVDACIEVDTVAAGSLETAALKPV